MKKLTALLLMAAIVSWVFGPGLVVATNVATGLTRDTTGGATPIVKAKWEANATYNVKGLPVSYNDVLAYYKDDSSTAGAQFLPSGMKDINKEIAICAIVTDPDGLADVQNVYADVFYPESIELGDSHIPLDDQSGLGCGELMQEDSLERLSKEDGIELFCDNVRTQNYNLPVFESGYDYDEICAQDGELLKETAAVYCTTKNLSYEDPSGEYKVWAVAQDQNGLQGTLENYFTYLRVTAFEADFDSIDYGNVRLNTHKIISGDLTWDETMNAGGASVRNVGNTRLSMKVRQDDMGFGKTDGLWNVEYDARVGSYAPFSNYWPGMTETVLADSLDLSELNEMDFSVDISKFPPTHDGESYIGMMVLSVTPESHLVCDPSQG